MKAITCDFCKKAIELDTFQSLPYGWTKFKMDSRVSGNIGGEIIKLDCCPQCGEVYKRQNLTKEKVVKLFKECLSNVAP